MKTPDISLTPFRPEDEEALYEMFREVIDSGCQFPYESSTREEFYLQFLNPSMQVYVCRTPSDAPVGAFCLRANYSGRSSHIANASYMVKSTHRGQGIGSFLVEASLRLAKQQGFTAMQYNMVLSQNIPAVKLYQKLGFQTIGTIPQAVRNPDGSYQDGLILYRSLSLCQKKSPSSQKKKHSTNSISGSAASSA